MPVGDLREAAADNNARWCDLVCRAHGAATSFHPHAWVSATRSPPAYPDAVTLAQEVDAAQLLAQVDASGGCSVKDSLASLDLSGSGFTVLFEARWFYRPADSKLTAPAWPRWDAVRSPDALGGWAAAHGGGDVFRPALLEDPTVVFLAATDRDAALVAGAVGNRTGAVVGVSNLFTVGADPVAVWLGAATALSSRFPGLPLVGYEHGDDLTAAHAAGFVDSGDLRVWLKPGDRPNLT
jgi:hypothetical protein